ncbi:MAG: ISAs1 family transposase [Lactobacillales bacterium]|jgi:predicted transposase YbfD/YdcC|nr:ISAs1 family transposase [Lactobacillales bacterium]
MLYLDTLEDIRQSKKVKHKLSDIVLLVLLAMLANIEYWEEIEDFARFYEKILKKYLELPNGIPSHDTIQRVMGTLHPKVTAELQIMWVQLVSEKKKNKLRKIFNLDGKTTHEKRFYMQSFYDGAEEFARAVRGHWAIESMHWLLDVTFHEDANQTLNKTAAQNLNHLRKLSLAILRSLDLGKKMSYSYSDLK